MTTSTSPLPAAPFRPVRVGVPAVLATVSVLLLLIAVYYVWNARALATVGGEIPNNWSQAFGSRTVWPVLLWSALTGAAGLLGAYFLNQAREDQPARIVEKLVFIFFVLAVAMALIPIYLVATVRPLDSLRFMPIVYWSVILFFTFVLFGLLLLTLPSPDPVQVRLCVMGCGGVVGLLTVLFGFALPLWTYRSTFGGGLDAWRENWPAVFWPALATFGALLLMFISLQLGRGLERQNQNVRRLIYGYNAVMTGLLLLAVLSLVNVLAYAEPFTRVFGRPFDWTEGNINALSPATRNMLADLQEPVKVYTFLRPGTLVNADMRTLLENCRGITPKFNWESVPMVQTQENITRLLGMMEKYGFSDPRGILVLAGSETGTSQPAFAFVKASDLTKQEGGDPRSPQSRGKETFIGESALLGAIQTLLEGKMTIYFTQGHREWSPEGGAPTMPGRPPAAGGNLSTLKEKLMRRRGVEVKTLTIDRNTKKIPDDASVVVVARPYAEFSKEELTVFRDYLRRNRQGKKVKAKGGKEVEEDTVTAGRMVLLLEPHVPPGGDSKKLRRSGLEPLLAEYNVKLGENRILSLSQSPTAAPFEPPEDATNPIARAFATGREFVFVNAQTVEPIAPQGSKRVEKLLVTPEKLAIWAEPNFDADASALARRLYTDRKLLATKLSPTPLCVAVAVSDQGAGGAPRDAAHAGLDLGKDTPRMVVFGAASWLDNASLTGARGAPNVDLFSSSVSWLREKTAAGESGSAEGKDRKLYSLGLPEDQSGRVIFLPLGLMVLGIVGMGTGVWIVRRR